MRFAALLLLTACSTHVATPVTSAPTPAPGSEANPGTGYTRADVEFMSGMIGHHAQAIVMTRLAPTNGATAGIQRLAERIAISQQDEIDLMAAWLRKRNEKVPVSNAESSPEHFHHGPGHVMMPGMITPAQMDSLSRARGDDFDRRFLAYMIQHHRGAISMVRTLFASPGAGQEGEIFRFASDVEADQKTEIQRMQAMLDAMR
jgi:uncharacterized protein (DUF305 family)